MQKRKQTAQGSVKNYARILSSKDMRLLTTFLHEATYRNLSFEEKVPSFDSSVDRRLCMMA